jgi:hypothetical protein
MNVLKTIVGILVFAAGIALLFFDQTKATGMPPLCIGAGIGIAAAGSSEKKDF